MLDQALRGGMPCGRITELVGPAGVGKTQLCFTLAVAAVAPPVCGNVVYIDVEHKFSAARYVYLRAPIACLRPCAAQGVPAGSRARARPAQQPARAAARNGQHSGPEAEHLCRPAARPAGTTTTGVMCSRGTSNCALLHMVLLPRGLGKQCSRAACNSSCLTPSQLRFARSLAATSCGSGNACWVRE